MSNHKYFTIRILTKPYLKKYLQSLYGTPIIFTTGNYFGTVLTGLLERPSIVRESKEKLRMRVDHFTTAMEIYCPMWFLTQNKYGFDLSDANMISLNKLFEDRFTEDLYKACFIWNTCGVDIEDALEEFCKCYNIEVDEDITLDALKQKEYRYRKQLVEIDAFIVKNKPKQIQLSFF